jgi:hypothetical protein
LPQINNSSIAVDVKKPSDVLRKKNTSRALSSIDKSQKLYSEVK